ncbi:MAG: esterase family protein [Ruminococcus sp.]|nr:esterase family protein [Ruminococcus sp.]
MNKAIIAGVLSLLALSAVSCGSKSSSSALESTGISSETASEATGETTATAAKTSETRSVTEATTEPDYFSKLVYPDTMSDKEKAGTAYRELSLIQYGGSQKYGMNIITYSLNPDTLSFMKENADSIRELAVYDEELDTKFLVHITLPPDYDENKKYPVFFLTDSQFWINEAMMMRKMIGSGEAEPVIIVTLGLDYDRDGGSVEERSRLFIVHQEQTLDFITNDLMKLISANYKTDASRSVWSGHSWGGIFAHYALCNSDKYDYQPFKNYIIASALLSMTYNKVYWDVDIPWKYDDEMIEEHAACMREYDYFDRNPAMDKNVLICAGGNESSLENWMNGMSLTDNAKALCDRLTAHGVNAELKIYEGENHGTYLEEMLAEYLKKTFPAENSNNSQEEHKK